ncbi:17624_t:CDS:2 [Funneliformis geosporum]|nr:17624_t:CDS:2 [Funneliformis geosporum]
MDKIGRLKSINGTFAKRSSYKSYGSCTQQYYELKILPPNSGSTFIMDGYESIFCGK